MNSTAQFQVQRLRKASLNTKYGIVWITDERSKKIDEIISILRLLLVGLSQEISQKKDIFLEGLTENLMHKLETIKKAYEGDNTAKKQISSYDFSPGKINDDIKYLCDYIDDMLYKRVYRDEKLRRYATEWLAHADLPILPEYISAGIYLLRHNIPMSYFTDGIAKWHDLSDERKQLYNIHDLVKNCFMTYQGGIASPTTVARGLGEYKDLEVIKRELRHFLDRYKDIADHDMLKYNFLAERVTVDDQESEIHRYFTIKPENAQIWSKEKVFRYTTEEYFTAIRSCSRVCAIHGSDSPVEIIQDGFMLSAHERAVRKKRQGRLHPTLNIHFSLNHLYSEYDPAKSGQGAEVMFVFAAEALIEHFSIGGIPSSGDFPITFPHAHEKELPIRYGIIFIVDNQYTRPLKALAVTKGYRVHSYNGNFMQELLRLSNGSEKNIFPLQASSKLILKDIVLTTGYSSDSARSHFIQPVFGVK